MENYIKKFALSHGADVCGIGSIERFADAPAGFSPKDIFGACKSVVAVGIALPKGLYEVPSRLIYGHFNGQVCSVLDALEFDLAKVIEKKFGCTAVPVPCDAPNEYWDADTMTAKGLISMKHTAVQCGLGSIGKSSLLINPEYGNRLTVGAVLTDIELIADPIQPDLCIKGCSRCIDSCPTHAINNGRVDQSLCRPNTYGKTARGFDTVDCNRCRTVCPLRNGIK